jgi:hypothetical protein
MENTKSKRAEYSNYCIEHQAEFRNELRDDASLAITSWPGRTVALLMLLSSAFTFYRSFVEGNPNATALLFSYSLPISLIVFYPIATLVFAAIEKYSPLILDVLCLLGLMSYSLTIYLVISGSDPELIEPNVYLLLSGQVNMILLLSITFSYHVLYRVTVVRNIFFAKLFALTLYIADPIFFELNALPLIQGLLAGTVTGWIFFESIKARFYLRSTDADTRQHLYNQLSKLVYPHQLERIKLGDELENTMPLKEGKGIINVFDVQKSSEIRHERTQEFFMGVFQSFLQICMKGYEHNPLRSQAFRLKETGDGFISAIGYPFLSVDSRSLADSAVSTALLMFEAFNVEVEKFNYSRPIKAAMGLAYNSVQGTFQSGGIRSYDLFGEALIQASKYEELRKQPVLWDIFTRHANDLGLVDFHILIVQEVVYNSLSPSYRDLFVEIDLHGEELKRNNFQMMYDNDAKFIYFHILE